MQLFNDNRLFLQQFDIQNKSMQLMIITCTILVSNWRNNSSILLKITCKIFKLLEMSKIQMTILMLVTMMIQLLIKIYPVSNQKLSLLNPCHLGPVIQGFLFISYPVLKTTALIKSFNSKVHSLMNVVYIKFLSF